MIDLILSLVGTLLYPLFALFFVVMDALQDLFRVFAGVEPVGLTGLGGDQTKVTAGNSGLADDTGIVYFFLNNALVKNLFMSILILALFLLIIFTVMAFLKNAYAAKQKPWQEIVGSALKGLGNFIFIPVCCLLGVWLGNILLNAIDGATSSGGSMVMSRKVFICAAYNANKIRQHHDDFASLDTADEQYNKVIAILDKAEGTSTWNKETFKNGIKKGQDYEYYAALVDEIYANSGGGDIHIYAQWGVNDGYDLWAINYLVLIVVGIFMMNVLISLTYGMIKRMFMLLMLYVVSPALCAMYPLDDGNAVGSWKKSFLSNTISAYGAVAAMNIFMSLLPLVDKISITNWSAQAHSSSIDIIVQILVMVSGLYVAKEFIGTLSGWIGADNALSAGEGLRKQTQGAIGKTVGGAVGVFAKAAGAHKAGGSFLGSLGSQALGGMTKEFGIDIDKISKDAKKAYKEGGEDFTSKKKDKEDFFNKQEKRKDLYKQKLKNDKGEFINAKGEVVDEADAVTYGQVMGKGGWRGIGRGIKREFGYEGEITDDLKAAAYRAAGGDKTMQAIAIEDLTESNNANKRNQFVGSLPFIREKGIKSTEKMTETVTDILTKPAREKAFKESSEDVARTEAELAEHGERDGERDTVKIDDESLAKMKSGLLGNYKTVIDPDTGESKTVFESRGKFSAGEIEAKRMAIQDETDTSKKTILQQELQDMLNHNEAVDNKRALEQELKAGLEGLATAIENMGKDLKGAEKEGAKMASDGIKEAIEKGLKGADLAEAIKKPLEKLPQTMKDAVKEALKKMGVVV